MTWLMPSDYWVVCYLTCKVKQGVHLHQVVLDGRPADDDAHSHRYLMQPLYKLCLRILDFVTLHAHSVLQELNANKCLPCKVLKKASEKHPLVQQGCELTSSRIIKSHESVSVLSSLNRCICLSDSASELCSTMP